MENYFSKVIELFAKSDISTSTQLKFYRWITGEQYSEEKERALHDLWEDTTENATTETSPAPWQSLVDVHEKIGRRRDKANRKRLRFWQASAACLLLALLSSIYVITHKTPASGSLIEEYVPIAEMTRLTLPDGTEVQMNSTATLLYPERFTGETRSVYLIGEANFKVAKNEKQPFVVKSNDFQATALGTEFNIKAYPGDSALSATLLSGSIEVRFNNMLSALILKPNEHFTYNRYTKEEAISQPDIYDVTAWQRGELVFKSVTLEEIITALERKYPYSFVYTVNALKHDKYTFRFKGDTPFREVMDIIAEVSGNIKYRIENNKCYISPIH